MCADRDPDSSDVRDEFEVGIREKRREEHERFYDIQLLSKSSNSNNDRIAPMISLSMSVPLRLEMFTLDNSDAKHEPLRFLEKAFYFFWQFYTLSSLASP